LPRGNNAEKCVIVESPRSWRNPAIFLFLAVELCPMAVDMVILISWVNQKDRSEAILEIRE
jgi:hypothetical protein